MLKASKPLSLLSRSRSRPVLGPRAANDGYDLIPRVVNKLILIFSSPYRSLSFLFGGLHQGNINQTSGCLSACLVLNGETFRLLILLVSLLLARFFWARGI
jgi:hypothetical protein